MNQTLLSFALRLHASKRYRDTKKFIRDILNNSNNPYKKYIDITIIFLIMSSVSILVYEVKHPVPEWIDIYDIYFVSFVFLIEYLLRLWVYNDVTEPVVNAYYDARFLGKEFSAFAIFKKGLKEKLRYMLTPSALIDLLAIFPAYRPVRVLRIFVLFRVLKLLRYTKSINQFTQVLSNKKFELLTLLFLLIFVVMTAGIALYVMEEKQNPNIDSLFDAFYWALVTISTVGYGDIAPVTAEGRSISVLVIVAGIAMISFATSVIVSAFSEKLSELKENRIIEQINKSKSFLLICGYGQMTKMFLREYASAYENHIILEKSIERMEQARRDGYDAINEDASRYETLKKFNTVLCNITLLCLTSNDVENIYITLNAKSISKRIKVVARVNDGTIASKFIHAGADHILMPHTVANSMIHTAITQPVMYKAIHAMLMGKSVARIDEIRAYGCKGIIGKSIESLAFKRAKVLLMGIQRDKTFIFNPAPTELVHSRDILVVMGRKISLDYFKSLYEEERD